MDRNHRRRFGQNFLCDPALSALLAGDIPQEEPTPILEIGPGHGALTRPLLEKAAHLTAVEIDPECAALLRAELAIPNFEVVESDFMAFDLEQWAQNHPGAWIAGNLPYNVATPILLRILPHLHLFHGLMAMVQYEVAQRICAQPGCSDYGALSVQIQVFARARMLRKIPRESFHPRPNVLSATFLLEPLAEPMTVLPGFREFIFQCFSQKRKTLFNCLRSTLDPTVVRKALDSESLGPHARAEEIPLSTFLRLHTTLYKALNPDTHT